ncbi:MAG TPA: HAD-IA family hydrolase [Steroidobacteraceae bacterium]
MLKALLWDVDGTLAETERNGHLQAFNLAFEALHLPWRWSPEYYGELLAVAGGRERLLHDMQSQGRGPSGLEDRHALAQQVHVLKNRLYASIVAAGELPLREGVRELLQDCAQAGLRVGIVTTTSRSNVAALLNAHLGRAWEERFATVVSADEAALKKPDPQAYLLALQELKLRPHEALAMEDAPAGLAAAQAAGIPVIVTRSYYFPTTATHGALAVGPSLGRPAGWNPAAESRAARIDLAQITRWFEHGKTLPR